MLLGWGASSTSSSSNRSAAPESTLAARTASTTRSRSTALCFVNPSNGAGGRRDPSRASASSTWLVELPANAPHPGPSGAGGEPPCCGRAGPYHAARTYELGDRPCLHRAAGRAVGWIAIGGLRHRSEAPP